MKDLHVPLVLRHARAQASHGLEAAGWVQGTYSMKVQRWPSAGAVFRRGGREASCLGRCIVSECVVAALPPSSLSVRPRPPPPQTVFVASVDVPFGRRLPFPRALHPHQLCPHPVER